MIILFQNRNNIFEFSLNKRKDTNMKLIKYITVLACVFCIGAFCGCEPLESKLPNTTSTPKHTASPIPTKSPTIPPEATPYISPSPDNSILPNVTPDVTPLLPDNNPTASPDILPDATDAPNQDEARDYNPTYPIK